MGTRVADQASPLSSQPTNDVEVLRQEILDKVAEYCRLKYGHQPFEPGKSRVQYAGRVFDSEEMTHAVDAVLDFWLTLGRFGREFERKLCEFVGVRSALLVNSGSSANLVAVTKIGR